MSDEKDDLWTDFMGKEPGVEEDKEEPEKVVPPKHSTADGLEWSGDYDRRKEIRDD